MNLIADTIAQSRRNRAGKESLGEYNEALLDAYAVQNALDALGPTIPTERPAESLCPIHIRESIDAYVQQGRPIGSFLRAVLCNDLKEAIGRADEANLAALPHIVAYVYNRVPFAMWGSEEKVDLHVAKGADLERQLRAMTEREP